ncbi:hypothetical protein LWI28_026874 [Acer negundo]|uniref:Carbonic anhydrase n=1 Tax=Acer negundo TaxID=4023 RepID=A0AAD5JKK7_ACENE|nr:hypothetical protein LWI28_026874 [Acer negundo]KAK4851890.1 hypothetical protein QYF36_019211 [Acer negundo]
MVWPIRSKLSSMVSGDSLHCSRLSAIANSFTRFPAKWPVSDTKKLARVYDTQLGSPPSLKRNSILKLELSTAIAVTQDGSSYEERNVPKPNSGLDFFEEMRQRFLSFKKHKYLKELEHFQALAEVQSPKFMVIACVDSRVCPSNVLGLQPGETFMIRNVANLVPPLQNGPSETNAALEFAVNTLEVEKILIIGHSCCGGIQTLMSMQDDENSSSFTEKWVINAKIAKLRTKAEAAHLSFDQQCRHCEKESINRSLLNLLTYPWIEDKVRKELLSLHGGYYDLLNCTFEKWTLDYERIGVDEEGGRFSVKDHSFWC